MLKFFTNFTRHQNRVKNPEKKGEKIVRKENDVQGKNLQPDLKKILRVRRR